MFLAQIIPHDKEEVVDGPSGPQTTIKRGNFTEYEQEIIIQRLLRWQKTMSEKFGEKIELQIFVNDYQDGDEIKRKGIYLRLNHKKAYKMLFSHEVITIPATQWKPNPEYEKDVKAWKKETIKYLTELKKCAQTKSMKTDIAKDIKKVESMRYIPIEYSYRRHEQFEEDYFNVLDLDGRGLYQYIFEKYRVDFESNYNIDNVDDLLVEYWESDCDFEQIIEHDNLIPLERVKVVKNLDLSDLKYECIHTQPYSNFDFESNYDLHTLVLLDVPKIWNQDTIFKLFEPYLTNTNLKFEWHVGFNKFRKAFVVAYVKFEQDTNDARMIIIYHKHERYLPTRKFTSFIRSLSADSKSSKIMPESSALQIYLFNRRRVPTIVSEEDYVNYKRQLSGNYQTREEEVRAIVEMLNKRNLNPVRTQRFVPVRNNRY